MELLNPFIYGIPVPVERHINREDAVRKIFSRIKNKESTAIVGYPQIGKTSLLKYILSNSVLNNWLRHDAKNLIPVEVDVYAGWLSVEKTPADFWRFVFEKVETSLEAGQLRDGIKSVRSNQYGSATLVNYFKLMGNTGKRVLLVIDEFDSLLHHPNFSNAEFFGALRSLATNTEGLQLITSSVTSVEEMDELAYKINPLAGSPFFNNFTNVRLELFNDKAIDNLIDSTLEPTGIVFGKSERDFVVRVSGRHPFRVQAACASLFDQISNGEDSGVKYSLAIESFRTGTEHHFSHIWKRLDEKSKTVLVIMTILWLHGIVLGKEYGFGQIEKSQVFEPELQKLSSIGLVEKVGQRSKWQWDSENLLIWRDQKWQISCEGMVWWLTHSVLGNSREIPNVEKWLHDQEVVGYLLTRKQWGIVKSWLQKVPSSLGNAMNSVIDEFLKMFFRRNPK